MKAVLTIASLLCVLIAWFTQEGAARLELLILGLYLLLASHHLGEKYGKRMP